MNIIVNEKIRVKNPTPAIQQYCNEKLTLDNPDYYKKERMGKWTGNTPRTIALYEKVGGDLWLPFGCIQDIWRLCAGKNVPWSIEIAKIRQLKYQSNIKLYDYQEKAVNEALRKKNGILVMPCGSGKTQSGLEIISRIGGRALWLTHTQDLLNQSKKRAESVLNCAKFGTITAGKVNIGESITFATVQTMINIDLEKYKDYWDIVIVDECQHCCGSPTRVTQFYKVVSQLCARYKFGLTATPKRADGLEKSMFALLGDIVCEVSREEVKETTCPVGVKFVETGYMPDLNVALSGDGTINYAGLVDDLTHNSKRFKCVSNTLETLEGAVLVLTNRVEYLQHLEKEYRRKSVCLSALGNSKAAKAERKEALRKLNDGEISCVFCTYQLAAEGLDCPNLKYVVFATPEKDPTRIQQASGRVGRKAEGKERGIVIDFIDDFGMYKGWAKKRESVYKKLGYAIM